MNFFEKKLSGKTVYSGKILNLEIDSVELPDGSRSQRECIRHSGGAGVFCVDKGKVILVKQFRYLYGKEMYEIPAGKLEVGELPEVAAIRELEEETGYRAKRVVPYLKLYPTPGYTDEIIYIYFAENFEYTESNPDKGEFVKCDAVPIEDVVKMIENGEICDAKTVCSVYKYLNG